MAAIAGWMREGKLKDRVDVMHGLENAPAALARVFTGANQGKQVLKFRARARVSVSVSGVFVFEGGEREREAC